MRILRNIRICSLNFTNCRQNSTAVSVKENVYYAEKIKAWQIHSYGGIEELKLYDVKMPIISKQNQVIVRVEAASVNPIDVAMTNGYGATVINLMRKTRNIERGINLFDSTIEFPLTMGRDFAGTVVSKGHGVGSRLNLGDKVWGVVPIKEQGCHATHVVVDESLVQIKPEKLSTAEAASIPYAGLTAWSALWLTGGLCYRNLFTTQMNKSVLVLGGSGGVGTIAIQLLKAWNMRVVTTCRSDAIKTLEDLGADVAIDYQTEDADSLITDEGPYEIILDCANQGPDTVKSKGYPFNSYITLNSPLLKNIDQDGLIAGSIKNLGNLITHNIPKSNDKRLVKWAFFVPCESGMIALQEMVESDKLEPVIDTIYPFRELPEAYRKVSEGHLRGKVVIDMT